MARPNREQGLMNGMDRIMKMLSNRCITDKSMTIEEIVKCTSQINDWLKVKHKIKVEKEGNELFSED